MCVLYITCICIGGPVYEGKVYTCTCTCIYLHVYVHLCSNVVSMCVYIMHVRVGGPGCEGKVSAIHGWEQESFVSYFIYNPSHVQNVHAHTFIYMYMYTCMSSQVLYHVV